MIQSLILLLGLIRLCAHTLSADAPLLVLNLTFSWKPRGIEGAQFILETKDDMVTSVEDYCRRFEFNTVACDALYENVRSHVYPDMLYGKMHNASGLPDFCHQRPHMEFNKYSKDPFVSVIIPSKGRVHIMDTLKSLDAQTDQDFEAILVLDGVSILDIPHKEMRMHRPYLCIVELDDRLGRANSAGGVRNIGITYASGKFVAFLDDDDEWSPDYVQRLREEYNKDPTLDAVLFRLYLPRMFTPSENILPRPTDRDFYDEHVGISVAILRGLFSLCTTPDVLSASASCGKNGIAFVASPNEDFALLDNVRRKGYRMLLSRYITYFARSCPGDLPSSYSLQTRGSTSEINSSLLIPNSFVLPRPNTMYVYLNMSSWAVPAVTSGASAVTDLTPTVAEALGDQMFQMASLLGTVALSGSSGSSGSSPAVAAPKMIPCFMVDGVFETLLWESFVLSPEIQFNQCPTVDPERVMEYTKLKEAGYALYDETLLENILLTQKHNGPQPQQGRDDKAKVQMHQVQHVEVVGYLQSYRYFYAIRSYIKRLFTFQPNVLQAAQQWARGQKLLATDSLYNSSPNGYHKVICIDVQFPTSLAFAAASNSSHLNLEFPSVSWYAQLLEHLHSEERSQQQRGKEEQQTRVKDSFENKRQQSPRDTDGGINSKGNVVILFSNDFPRALRVIGGHSVAAVAVDADKGQDPTMHQVPISTDAETETECDYDNANKKKQPPGRIRISSSSNGEGQQHISCSSSSSGRPHDEYDIRLARGNTAAVDMAIMSNICTDIVLSRGTFGWWSAYLATLSSTTTTTTTTTRSTSNSFSSSSSSSSSSSLSARRIWYAPEVTKERNGYYPLDWIAVRIAG